MSESKVKKRLKKLGLKTVKAMLETAILGVFLFIIWLLISPLLMFYPEYLAHFAVLLWALIFFTFTIKISEGTFYKYIFIIIRGFFFMMYIAHFTNYGVLTINATTFTSTSTIESFTVGFVPLLALMIFINLLTIIIGLLQAMEFTSQSPKD